VLKISVRVRNGAEIVDMDVDGDTTVEQIIEALVKFLKVPMDDGRHIAGWMLIRNNFELAGETKMKHLKVEDGEEFHFLPRVYAG
jgi:phage gpG-like protein